MAQMFCLFCSNLANFSHLANFPEYALNKKLDQEQNGRYADPTSPQRVAVCFCMFVSEGEGVKTEKSMCVFV